MRLVTTGAVIMALVSGPAFSQSRGAPDPKAEAEAMEQKKRAQDIEREYKALVKKTAPQATAPSDPWENIRPAPPAKPQR
jgi:hypothetical protein